MASRYVLDSSAVLAYLQDEPGSSLVEDLIIATGTELHLSAVNLGEVLCVVERSHCREAAVRVEAAILDTPKIQLAEATWERVRAAAQLKAHGGIAFADCFAAALAQELSAELVTCDREFARLETDGLLRVTWLP